LKPGFHMIGRGQRLLVPPTSPGPIAVGEK